MFSVDFYLTSYFSIIRTMASRQFDIRLIPEFSSAATDIPIMEWLEDLELICELCKITKVEQVLPLRLKGTTRETYQQLSKEQWNDIEKMKSALIKAYRTDSFMAFDQFTTHCLHPEESVDEFLTDFQQLAWLVGEMPPECWMKNPFISGLPSHVRGFLQSSTRMETLTLRELLERACVVLVDTKDEHLAAAAWPTLDLCETSQRGLNCFRCGGPNHLTRDCMQHSSVGNGRERSTMCCYLCNKTGHLVKNCLGNRNSGRW